MQYLVTFEKDQDLRSRTVKALPPAFSSTEGRVGGASLPRYAR